MFKDNEHPKPPLGGSKTNGFERFTKTSPRLCRGYLTCMDEQPMQLLGGGEGTGNDE
jgi:hypothetical protein